MKKNKSKKEKLVSAKKLPGIFKKVYPQKKLETKIYKKIFISADLELIKSLFEPHPQKLGSLFIPRDKQIPKKQLKKLKSIAKEIKRQKPSFKLVPFAATAGIIAATAILFITFKNVVAKKAITGAMQAAFGAKTELSSVNIELLGGSITIKNLQQANKNSPMKNLFQAEKIEISFNLTEALRGKFDAENIELSGFEVNTERKASGELHKKQKKQKEKKTKSESSFDFSQKKNEALNAAKNSIQEVFAEYNPQNIIKDLEGNLKSPETAKQVQAEAEALVSKWKNKPEELETQVKDFDSSVRTVLDTDWGNINDIAKLKQAVENVNSAMEKSKSLTKNIQSAASDVKSDSKKISGLSSQVKNAIASDNALINSQLSKITSFKISDGKKILGNTLDSVFYSMAGDYYPYIKQATDYALQAKASSTKTEKPKTKKEKKQTISRVKGTDVYWKQDRVPKFLIEKVSFSGLNLYGNGTDITNDMDKRGAPALINGGYSTKKQTHKVSVTVDTRSKTQNSLVNADYSGDNFPIKFSTPYLGLNSSTAADASGTIEDDGSIKLKAKFNLKNISFSSESFEPKFAYSLYKTALSNINDLNIEASAVFNGEEKFNISVDSDLDKKFIKALKETADKEISSLVSEAKKEIAATLNEKTNGATEIISEFVNIENGINRQSVNMDKLNSLLEKKKADLQKQIEAKTKNTAEKALKDAGISIPNNKALNDSIEKGANSLKGLFK